MPCSALPFHEAIAAHLASTEPSAWSWFASAETQSQAEEHLQLELLKTCVRLDRETYGEVYAIAATAAERLELADLPLVALRAQWQGNRRSRFTSTDSRSNSSPYPAADRCRPGASRPRSAERSEASLDAPGRTHIG